MKTIFDVLTSKARIMVLRTLYLQGEAIPLRHLSAISGLPVFSVQNAIEPLLDETLIIRSEEGNNVLFELNKKHSLYITLKQFFIIEMNNRILLEAQLFCQKAKQVLAFAAAADVLFRRVKRMRART